MKPTYQQKIVDLWLERDRNEEYKMMAAFKIGLDEGIRRERQRKRKARKR